MTTDQLLLFIIAGLMSALVLSIVLRIIRLVRKNNNEPLWKYKLFSHTRISGAWETKINLTDSQDEYREEASISQTGHTVEGTLNCIDEPGKGNVYRFVGKIRNNIVNAYYWNLDRSSHDSGTFTLRIEENGQKLVGHTSYYCDLDYSLESREYVWTRIYSASNSVE